MESSRKRISRLLIFVFICCIQSTVSSHGQITKIHGLIFEPSYAKIGERLCMSLNYTIEDGHYLQRIQLDVDADRSTEIYSFSSNGPSDPGEPYYYDNDWGNRAGRARLDLNRTFCFRSIKASDMGLTFVWRLYTQSISPQGSKARFHYSFNLPGQNSVSKQDGPSPQGLTKINGIIFEPSFAKIGEPLCMTINYTIEQGQYLHVLQLEADTKGSEEEGTTVYSYTRQDNDDIGVSVYHNNEWGNRAIRTLPDADRKFCFQVIKASDLKQTFIWRLFSENIKHQGIKSRFHYFFNIPESKTTGREDVLTVTKMYGITFQPHFPKSGQSLCMTLNYTVETGHFLEKLELDVETDGGVNIYSFTKKNADDSGVAFYNNNDWGNRAEKLRHNLDKSFCFRYIKSTDLSYRFVWRLNSQNVIYSGIKSRFHYFFNIPEDGASEASSSLVSGQAASTKIHGINFTPSTVNFGKPLCMSLNYTVQEGHFLYKIELEVNADGGTEIYSFTKQNFEDPGRAFYYHNDWGNRADKSMKEVDKMFCFSYIKKNDMPFTFVWRLSSQSISQSHMKSRYSYSFRLPDQFSVSSHTGIEGTSSSSQTKVYGVLFDPAQIKVGNALCMTLNYTIQDGHFLEKLELNVDDEDNTEIYSFSKQNPNDPGNAHYQNNEWGNRADKSHRDNYKTFCFRTVRKSDLSQFFVWTVHSQNIHHPGIIRRFRYTFSLPGSPSSTQTKIYGVIFDPAHINVGSPLCMTLNYTIQDNHFLEKLELNVDDEDNTKIYSFTKKNSNEPGIAHYQNNEWGNRADKSHRDKDKTFCFRIVRRNDLRHSFVWIVQSQNIIHSGIQRKFSYIFRLPDQEIKAVDVDKLGSGHTGNLHSHAATLSADTKVYGVQFNPSYARFGQPLCMKFNFTIQHEHFLNKMELGVNDGDGTEIFSLAKQNVDDSWRPVYSHNDWGNRLDKSKTGDDQICFTTIKKNDLSYSYVLRLISQNINNRNMRSRFSYNFRIPDYDTFSRPGNFNTTRYTSGTKIYGVIFDPHQASVGLPLCMTLNYTIQEGHFLQKMQITVDDDSEIYSFIRQAEDDSGETIYFDNDWGNRADKRLSIKDKTFCFKNIKQSDMDPSYVWTIQSQNIVHHGIKRRFHYIFNIPDYSTISTPGSAGVPLHSALTKIYGVQFDPLEGRSGRSLCMMLNYTIQEGHFLQKLQLEVDSDDNPQIYSFVKQNADDPGIVMYMENDWGDRAERTGKDKDKTFCFKTLKTSDADHTYVWTLQSQNSVQPGIKRRFRYIFTIPEVDSLVRPDETEVLPSTTKINGVKFEPKYTSIGDPMCMTLNYTLQEGHFLSRTVLEVDANGNREIYSVTRPRVTDPGVAIYRDNDWGNRAERRSHDKDKIFCFKFMKANDIKHDFIWTIQSQNILNHSDRKKSQYIFNLPESEHIERPTGSYDVGSSSSTRISGITFDPSYATVGEPLCMILNYTLQNGHFLLNSDLEVEDEDGIYSFKKQSADDTGIVIYSNNDWGDRAERLRDNRERVFCFDTIKISDMGQKFTWSIQSQSRAQSNIKRKFHYTFALQDYDSFMSGYNNLPAYSRPSLTKVNGVSYNTPTVRPGEPLCLTLNYTLQDGHFLNSMDLEVDANDGTEVYFYSKSHANDSEVVAHSDNEWGNRVKLMRKDRDKTICFHRIEKDDLDHLFTATIVSQSLVSPMIRRKAQYTFALPESDLQWIPVDPAGSSRPLFTKIYGVNFDPPFARPERPLCMTVNYTLQDENFLHRLILEVSGEEDNKLYSFIKLYPDDAGIVVHYDNKYGSRAERARQDFDRTFCFTNVEAEDFEQTFVWRLQSQNIYHKDLHRTSHYTFSIPDENSFHKPGKDDALPYSSQTNINGVHFKPIKSLFNEPLCIYLNYTLQDGHYLSNALLEVQDGKDSIPMYSFSRYVFNDPGRATYFANDWSARADRTNQDLGPTFCFKNVKEGDASFKYKWKIISQSFFNQETAQKSHQFTIPDGEIIGKLDVPIDYATFEESDYSDNATIITIHNVLYNPPEVIPGHPLCLTLNYSIHDGYYLHRLFLQTDLEESAGIYSFTKKHPNDRGVPFYYDNEWGSRGSRRNEDLNRTFCFKVADESDIATPYIWKVYAKDNYHQGVKAKQSQAFSIPDMGPHDHYGGFDDRNHVTVELIVGLMVAFVVLFAFLGLLLYFCCCKGGLDKNCTCTPQKSCGRDSEACLAQQRLISS